MNTQVDEDEIRQKIRLVFKQKKNMWRSPDHETYPQDNYEDDLVLLFADQTQYKQMLCDLLAIIHRDGGHYITEHGLDKAWKDAMQLSSDRIQAQESHKGTEGTCDCIFNDGACELHEDKGTGEGETLDNGNTLMGEFVDILMGYDLRGSDTMLEKTGTRARTLSEARDELMRLHLQDREQYADRRELEGSLKTIDSLPHSEVIRMDGRTVEVITMSDLYDARLKLANKDSPS